MKTLLDTLTTYASQDYYPFHMPGHKRRPLDFPNPWSVDITEIEDFDNLHHAEGILMELQQRAAAMFGARESYCLVNGSTCGLLSAISGCVKSGGTLLMSRNCHKSVYHGVHLRNLTPVYMMPQAAEGGILGSLEPETVAEALAAAPQAQAVLVVSPTYDGVVSDIRRIAEIVHGYGIPLIVDEAHGAHFPFSEKFPDSAISLGADVVIQSLHKTLPAFTQTALLHICSDLPDVCSIRRYLGIYQSSSPSYLLMASVGQCLALLEAKGGELFSGLRRNLDDFYKKCGFLEKIRVFSKTNALPEGCFDWDDSKILILPQALGLSGQDIYEILLKKYHLQLEMASGHYALALSSLMDEEEGFCRLFTALAEIDKASAIRKETKSADMIDSRELYRLPPRKMTVSQALEQPGQPVLLTRAAGAVSQEYLFLYPPGIPLLVPGEVITDELLARIRRIQSLGLSLEGLLDLTNTRINVVIS